ncbi:MAG: hypothetical protein MRERV_34c008 [Mycoplasmataceae bacterium RV_VA103A]|nr:MAG: hypothetical protein MRERV_34c008 [Mycoplasmataceae bacterium RV_VA103A]
MTLCCHLKKEYLIATYKIFQKGESAACKSPFITEVTRKSYYLDQQYMILKSKVCPACRSFWEELKEAFENINHS